MDLPLAPVVSLALAIPLAAQTDRVRGSLELDLLADVRVGFDPASSNPVAIEVAGENAYVLGSRSISGAVQPVLYKLKDSAAGGLLRGEPWVLPSGSHSDPVALRDGVLLFIDQDLWFYGGTRPAGPLARFDTGSLALGAAEGVAVVVSGVEAPKLWRVGLSGGGAELLYTGTDAVLSEIRPWQVEGLGRMQRDGLPDLAYFVVETGETSRIVVSDGTAEGTLAWDRPGTIRAMLSLDQDLVWVEEDLQRGVFQFWSGDGSPQGSVRIREERGILREDVQVASVAGRAWFALPDLRPANGSKRIYCSDGTSRGTAQVMGLIGRGFGSEPVFPSVRFLGLDVDGERTLMAVEEDAPGSEFSYWSLGAEFAAVEPLGFARGGTPWSTVGNRLLAQGNDRTWYLMSVRQPFRPGSEIRGEGFAFGLDRLGPRPAVLGGRILFPNADDGFGAEVWVTDGTRSGTKLWADLESGNGVPKHSMPESFVAVAGETFFTALNAAGERRVFFTREGGEVVEEAAGAGYTLPQALTEYAGECYFVGFVPQPEGTFLYAVDRSGSVRVVTAVERLTSHLVPAGDALLVLAPSLLGFPSRIFSWDGSAMTLLSDFRNPFQLTREPVQVATWSGDRRVFAVSSRVYSFEDGALTLLSAIRDELIDLAVFDRSVWILGRLAEPLRPPVLRLGRIGLDAPSGSILQKDPVTGRIVDTNLVTLRDRVVVPGVDRIGFFDRQGDRVNVFYEGAESASLAGLGGGVLAWRAGRLDYVDPNGVQPLLSGLGETIAVEVANDREAYVVAESETGAGAVFRVDGDPLRVRRVLEAPVRAGATALANGRGWLAMDGAGVGIEPYTFRPALSVETVGDSCARGRRIDFRVGQEPVSGALLLSLRGSTAAFGILLASESAASVPLGAGCSAGVDLGHLELALPIALDRGAADIRVEIPPDGLTGPMVLQAALGPSDAVLGYDLSPALRIER